MMKGRTMDNVCYKCPDRSAECHSTCEKYIEWKKAHEEKANAERAAKQGTVEYMEMATDRKTRKMRRERHEKR